MGRDGHGDRRNPSGQRNRERRAAYALLRRAGPLQDSQAHRAHTGAARADAFGKAPATGAPMSFDANAHRSSSLAGWEEAAPGWVRRQDAIRALGAPVSQWMVDAVSLRPFQRVLELAAGL